LSDWRKIDHVVNLNRKNQDLSLIALTVNDGITKPINVAK